MFPGGSARGPNVAFSPRSRDGDAETVGPISRAPWARTTARSSSWRCLPSVPVSVKPAEITQIARDAVTQRRGGRLEHVRGGEADDGQIDRIGVSRPTVTTRERRRRAYR